MFESLSQGIGDDFTEKRLLPRPSIPFLVICAGVFWVAVACFESIDWMMLNSEVELPHLQVTVLMLALMAFFAVVSMRMKGSEEYRRKTTIVVLSCFFISGAICACVFWGGLDADRKILEDGLSGELTYEISSDARSGALGFHSDAILVKNGMRIPLQVYWKDKDDIQASGSLIHAYGIPKAAALGEKGRYAHRNGRSGTVSLHSPVFVAWAKTPSGLMGPHRQKVISDLKRFDGDGASLLQGILVGERSRIDGTSCEQDFKTCGIAHLIAVSGSHLAVVSAIFMWLTTVLGAGRKTSIITVSGMILAYLMLSGVQVSALRACMMTLAGLLASFSTHRKDTRSALGIAVCLIIAIDPVAAFSFSFGLSVLAVLGICFLAPLFTNWIAFIMPRQLSSLSQPVAFTLAAQFACMPLTIPTFGLLSPISPVANIIIAPLFDVLLAFGLLASMISPFIPLISHIVYWTATLLASLICGIAHLLSKVPFASVPASASSMFCVVTVSVLGGLLWVFHPRPKRIGVIFLSCFMSSLLVLYLVPYAIPARPSMTMLDIGQGDAILISSGYHHILIDAGEEEKDLAQALQRNHVRHIDAVFITHLHKDHYGGLDGIAAHARIEHAYLPRPILEIYENNEAIAFARKATSCPEVSSLEVGENLALGPFTLSVLSPGSITDKGGNQDSLCFRLSFDGDDDGHEDFSGLLCGDAESQTTEELGLENIDVLKVGHHGSATSLSDSMLGELDPHLALISVGASNSYGHPDEETINLLREKNIMALRTDICGDITVRFTTSRLNVSCATMSLD